MSTSNGTRASAGASIRSGARPSRRATVAVAAAVCVLLVSACDWATYRGNAEHTGESFGESTIGVGNVATLTPAWTTSDDNSAESTSGPAVVAGGRLYVQNGTGLAAFDAAGTGGCAGSPVECHPVWRASSYVSYATVANGLVYGLGAESTGPATSVAVLQAFDASGTTGCSGTPPTCQPLWSGSLGPGAGNVSPPTIVGGVVYLTAVTFDANVLLAFDAAGQEGCTGIPVVCQPLWTAAFGEPTFYGDGGRRSPSVANGRVFVSGFDNVVHVYDAAGQQGCGGSPKTCGELWIAEPPLICDVPYDSCGLSTPAVTGGVVYVNTVGIEATGGVYAFDANGVSSCNGSPKRCSPLWRANAAMSTEPLAVANGVVIAAGQVFQFGPRRLRAFDAAGNQGCSGAPKTCAPLWESSTSWEQPPSGGAPVVANGVAYVTAFTDPSCQIICTFRRHVYAYDVAGVQGCTGAPKQCAPLLDLTGPPGPRVYLDPVIANGMLYVKDENIQSSFGFTLVLHAYRLP